MDSAHHGCARSSLLRDAIGVSLCLWGGLSLFYRLLSTLLPILNMKQFDFYLICRLFAFLVAPSIRIRHCLCLTGYSFYSWIVALLVSYGLRVYYPYLHFPPKIGLVLFSVPCAIAQVSYYSYYFESINFINIGLCFLGIHTLINHTKKSSSFMEKINRFTSPFS